MDNPQEFQNDRNLEASEQSSKDLRILDNATFEPEALVERSTEIEQAEAIESAFVNVVDSSINEMSTLPLPILEPTESQVGASDRTPVTPAQRDTSGVGMDYEPAPDPDPPNRSAISALEQQGIAGAPSELVEAIPITVPHPRPDVVEDARVGITPSGDVSTDFEPTPAQRDTSGVEMEFEPAPDPDPPNRNAISVSEQQGIAGAPSELVEAIPITVPHPRPDEVEDAHVGIKPSGDASTDVESTPAQRDTSGVEMDYEPAPDPDPPNRSAISASEQQGIAGAPSELVEAIPITVPHPRPDVVEDAHVGIKPSGDISTDSEPTPAQRVTSGVRVEQEPAPESPDLLGEIGPLDKPEVISPGERQSETDLPGGENSGPASGTLEGIKNTTRGSFPGLEGDPFDQGGPLPSADEPGSGFGLGLPSIPDFETYFGDKSGSGDTGTIGGGPGPINFGRTPIGGAASGGDDVNPFWEWNIDPITQQGYTHAKEITQITEDSAEIKYDPNIIEPPPKTESVDPFDDITPATTSDYDEQEGHMQDFAKAQREYEAEKKKQKEAKSKANEASMPRPDGDDGGGGAPKDIDDINLAKAGGIFVTDPAYTQGGRSSSYLLSSKHPGLVSNPGPEGGKAPTGSGIKAGAEQITDPPEGKEGETASKAGRS